MVFNSISKLIVYFIYKNDFCFKTSTFNTLFVALVVVNFINLPPFGTVHFARSNDEKVRIKLGNVSKGK